MQNRNHTLTLVAVGLLLACATPSGAAEPASTVPAKDHDCNLPANVRNKVEHCDQVGDFDATGHHFGKETPPGGRQSLPGQSQANPLASPTKPEKKSKKQKKNDRSSKKDSFLEIKTDTEDPTKAK